LLRGDTGVRDGSGDGGRPPGSDLTCFKGPAALKPLNKTNIGLLKEYLEQQDSEFGKYRSVRATFWMSQWWYTRVMESCGYSLIALSAGRPVGCICCSLEEDSAAAVQTPFTPLQTISHQSYEKTEAQPQKKLVKIMLLQVSTEDRCRGIGSNMLRSVIRAAKADSHISRLVLDVHVKNEGAIRLYRRFGFYMTGSKQNHSKSWIMELSIGDLVNKAVEKTKTTAATVQSYPQITSSSAPKEHKSKEEIKEENNVEHWRQHLAKKAEEKWKNQMEVEKERRGIGGRGEKKEAGTKNPLQERKDSSIITRSNYENGRGGDDDTKGHGKRNIAYPNEQEVRVFRPSNDAAANIRDVAPGTVELLDQITKRAKERVGKMARTLQTTPLVSLESTQRHTGNGVRIKARFESSVRQRVRSRVGQRVGIGSQSSLVNHEDVMVRLGKKANLISAGGHPGLRNPSHHIGRFTVSPIGEKVEN